MCLVTSVKQAGDSSPALKTSLLKYPWASLQWYSWGMACVRWNIASNYPLFTSIHFNRFRHYLYCTNIFCCTLFSWMKNKQKTHLVFLKDFKYNKPGYLVQITLSLSSWHVRAAIVINKQIVHYAVWVLVIVEGRLVTYNNSCLLLSRLV